MFIHLETEFTTDEIPPELFEGDDVLPTGWCHFCIEPEPQPAAGHRNAYTRSVVGNVCTQVWHSVALTPGEIAAANVAPQVVARQQARALLGAALGLDASAVDALFAAAAG